MTTVKSVKSLLKELDIRFLARDNVLLVPVGQDEVLHIAVRANVVDIYGVVEETRRGQDGFRAACDSVRNLNLALPAVSLVFSDGADGGSIVATLQIPIGDEVFDFCPAALKHCLGLLHEAVDLVREPVRMAKYTGQVTDMTIAFAMHRLRQFSEAGIQTSDDLKTHEFSSEETRREAVEAFKEAQEVMAASGLRLSKEVNAGEEGEPVAALAIAGI